MHSEDAAREATMVEKVLRVVMVSQILGRFFLQAGNCSPKLFYPAAVVPPQVWVQGSTPPELGLARWSSLCLSISHHQK